MGFSRHHKPIVWLVACACLALAGADWPRFRGPAGTGQSDEPVAARWSATEGVRWKAALPGPGASSPIVFGPHVFVTCYTGYGLRADSPGDPAALTLHLLCVDKQTGKIVWDRATKAKPPERDYGSFLALHGYASPSPVTDGQMVYAFFGRTGVLAYTIEGQPQWQADVGSKTHNWGTGASPILHKNLLLVNASVESQAIVALDKRTGQRVWKVDGIRESWSTPLVVDLPGVGSELVVSGQDRALGLNPATGAELWRCRGIGDYVCSAVIAHDDVVFLFERSAATESGDSVRRRAATSARRTSCGNLAKRPRCPRPSIMRGICTGPTAWRRGNVLGRLDRPSGLREAALRHGAVLCVHGACQGWANCVHSRERGHCAGGQTRV